MSFRSPKLLKAARDQSCVLCGSTGTTVACHPRSVALGSGTGIKAPDCLAVWCCQRCHDLLDNRVPGMTSQTRQAQWYLALAKTIVQLFEQDIVRVK